MKLSFLYHHNTSNHNDRGVKRKKMLFFFQMFIMQSAPHVHCNSIIIPPLWCACACACMMGCVYLRVCGCACVHSSLCVVRCSCVGAEWIWMYKWLNLGFYLCPSPSCLWTQVLHRTAAHWLSWAGWPASPGHLPGSAAWLCDYRHTVGPGFLPGTLEKIQLLNAVRQALPAMGWGTSFCSFRPRSMDSAITARAGYIYTHRAWVEAKLPGLARWGKATHLPTRGLPNKQKSG